MQTPSPLVRFRELMASLNFIPALGIWDPYTARVSEGLGIECVHTGGYQFGTHWARSGIPRLYGVGQTAAVC